MADSMNSIAILLGGLDPTFVPKLQRLCLCWWPSFVSVVVMEH